MSELDTQKRARRSVLLSIHLTSNRPDNFERFLDRLEAVTEDLSAVEVVVKIDTDDVAMNESLAREADDGHLQIAHISTPLAGGFYQLWRCYDELLAICDPKAYFLLPLNDEMHILTHGWDRLLRKYVGLFPDHIFRLRTSPHRFRTYFDFWEPGWVNDTSSFITKRWIDISGGWCPCNGPDSFQQCVAFYFGWLYRFDLSRPYREVPITEIDFGGSGEAIGMSGEALRRRHRGALKPWFTLMSHPMQQEAARRAQKLHAIIWSEARGLPSLEIRDDHARHRIEVIDRVSGAILRRRSYRLSWLRVTVTNAARKLNYGYYGGAGDDFRNRPFYNFIEYLCLRHAWIDRWREASRSRTDRLATKIRSSQNPFLRVAARVTRLCGTTVRHPTLIARAVIDPKRALRGIRQLLHRSD